MSDPRSAIPGIDRLLESPGGRALLDRFPRGRVVEALRRAVEEARSRLPGGGWGHSPSDPAPYAEVASAWLESDARPSLRPVINATGVLLHTNLGRAPLAAEARIAMERAVTGYANLEFDLATGGRGSRYTHCVDLLREVTGAEDALVVNNCAAGLVLSLAVVSQRRDVLVSRGELVEIGGGFRIPDMLRQGGARLREVGATNRTRVEDYRAAARAGGVGGILKVHRSNFRVRGFTESTSLQELRPVAEEAGVPLIHDLGSGLLIDPARLGLPPEPRPADSIREGADLVIFSGDKLLGGPQAGLIVGDGGVVSRLRESPLCRAFRVDKATLAALEATLRLYRDPEAAIRSIPVLRQLSTGMDELRERAEVLARAVRGCAEAASWGVETVESRGRVGGGTYPEHRLPSWAVRLVPSEDAGASHLAARLRDREPAVVGRLEDGALLLDVRSMLPGEEGTVASHLEVELGPGGEASAPR